MTADHQLTGAGASAVHPGIQRRTLSTVLAVVAGLLFVLAGALSVMAARLRWSDACSGGFDTESCVLIQDHRYDFLLPSEPWDPIPGGAELAGAGYIVVAVAVALVCCAVRSPAWLRVLQSVPVLSLLMIGVTTVMSGRAGAPVEPATSVATWLVLALVVVGPMALIVVLTQLAVGPRPRGLMPPLSWAIWGTLLVLATPLPEYFVVSLVMGYTSYDTTPWTGAASGVMFAAAGVVLIAGVTRNTLLRERSAQLASNRSAVAPQG